MQEAASGQQHTVSPKPPPSTGLKSASPALPLGGGLIPAPFPLQTLCAEGKAIDPPPHSFAAASPPPASTYGALASKLVDLVHAVPVVQAGAAGALVRVDLAVHALVACGLPCRERKTKEPLSACAGGPHHAPGPVRQSGPHQGLRDGEHGACCAQEPASAASASPPPPGQRLQVPWEQRHLPCAMTAVPRLPPTKLSGRLQPATGQDKTCKASASRPGVISCHSTPGLGPPQSCTPLWLVGEALVAGAPPPLPPLEAEG